MGCTSSTPAERQAPLTEGFPYAFRSISMPTHTHGQFQVADDFKLVALSSSKYGIMKLVNTPEELHVLGSTDSASKTWVEGTSIVEDLKPGLEKHFNTAGGPQVVGMLSAGRKSSAQTPDQMNEGADARMNRASPSCVKGTTPPEKFAAPEGNNLMRQGPNQHGRGEGKENEKPYANRKDTNIFSKESNGGRSADSSTGKVTSGKSSLLSRFFKKSASFAASQKAPSQTPASAQPGPPASSSIRSFERGDSLFDDAFLASYEKALKNLNLEDWIVVESHNEVPLVGFVASDSEARDTETKNSEDAQRREATENSFSIGERSSMPVMKVVKKKEDPLDKYEKICPPGGEKRVVLYTTSLRGIRKTFEDCNSLRAVLQSFCINIDERDVSMHQEFRKELRDMMGKPVAVPRLFIRGRYIGGAAEALELHEGEQLAELLEGIPKDKAVGKVCDGCGGARFVPCLGCSGSCRVVNAANQVARCPDCNENGLMQCPICC